ncbi:DUF2969 family protein [Pisciglobus halotolerans]|uniref:DUF2969 domain-containing protein n=1 Tax=Pisciglobus halotolerans TaxID=745365 RepID=A0A1I3BRT8_9LACT|nr:DUF2969 family protein [Pisciglobus halotolerans]SFH65007.1 Protein of unknown function [Pisciglobus halotolerans]
MAKGNKKNNVEIKETANNTADFVELEVVINKNKIGLIQQEGNKPVTLVTRDGKVANAASIDDAMNQLIMDYNLHYM